MTAGIPDEMRRTAWVSLAAHMVVLALLSMVPLVKMPPMGASSIQVMLVSKAAVAAPPAPVEPAPESKPVVKAAPPPVPKPVEPPAPVLERPVERPAPQAARPPVKERLAEALQQRLKEVAVPKPLVPVQKAPAVAQAQPPKPLPAVSAPPVVKQEPVVPKGDVPQDIKEVLRRAEESLMKTPNAAVSKPVSPSPATPPVSRPKATDEINKLLTRLPAPTETAPEGKKPASRPDQPRASLAEQMKTMLAQASPPSAPESQAQKKLPVVPAAQASKEPAPVPRAAALERCPPKAQAYCPLLQAAINRVWNADTDPGVRSVLENAGDSTATIRMVILPDGTIKEIQLSKSSGNDAYDLAVQSVLRELRHLPPLPAEMKGEPFVAVTSFTYNRKRDS
jgi:TonB family protein